MRYSSRNLALTYVALGIAALVLFAAPLWYAWQVTIQDGRAEILAADAARLTDVFRQGGEPGLQRFIETRVHMQIAYDRILLLTDGALHPLAGNLAAWPRGLPAVPGDYHRALDTGDHGAQDSLVHVARLGSDLLLVARDNRLFEPLERRFWYGLGAAAAVLSIAGLLIGFVTRRALMERVHSIQRTVSAIIHGDLTHRLPAEQAGDELATLARTINRMLEQIEQLVNGVRNVSNSIAHDLRTPLAELRARLEELALMRPAREATFAQIDAAVADVDRVIHIFDALLRLAEIDAGMRRSGFVSVDLKDLAATAIEFYAPAAELAQIELELEAPQALPIAGDPVLLAQALSNLIDNALKYTPAQGRVRVSVRRSGAGAELAVSDDGPGIAAAEKGLVVERFYRGDVSRGTPGVGLGLALVQAIAKLHGSTLELLDHHPGLRAVLLLPLEERPPAAPQRTPSAAGAAPAPAAARTS